IADACEFVIDQLGDFLTAQPVPAAGRRVEAADQVHERRLAGARRSHDRDVLVTLDEQVHATQGMDGLCAQDVVLAQILRPNDLVAHRLPGCWAAAAPLPVAGTARIGRTASPSFIERIASYGPATTESDSVRPESTSKCWVPAMPTSTGTNSAFPLRTTYTPSSSPCVCVAARAAASAAGSSCGTGCVPVRSRTVSAMIGTDRTLWR